MKKTLENLGRSFVAFFDGCGSMIDDYYIPPQIEGHSTSRMGVVKLDYDEVKNTLHVWLKRPGLLIGKGGETIDKVSKYLECEIYIHEVWNLWDWDTKLFDVDFSPMYPVGHNLIISAKNIEEAEKIAKKTISHTDDPIEVKEIKIFGSGVVSYDSGNY